MFRSLKRLTLVLASAFIIALAINFWAVPAKGAARSFFQRIMLALSSDSDTRRSGKTSAARVVSPPAVNRGLPASVNFRDYDGQGLLVKTWINGVGVFNFAIDTGAGAMILSERVAQSAHVAIKNGRATEISGMSGTNAVQGSEATLRSLALGDGNNFLPARGLVIVAENLPPGVDGILDPTEAYWPLGYSIDMPHGQIRAFDPKINPVRPNDAPAGGAVVPWLFDAESRRPFVMLSNGHRALLDTGSSFGFAVNENSASAFGIAQERGRERDGSRDIGGGRIGSRRVKPTNLRIGALMLYRVPTDLLSGVEASAPFLLGREALGPFEVTFDPANRLIRFTPPQGNQDI
ncbi:MAG TPA: aspartyl protease family protein [Pyrinomonadaceae bacterium]|jgi:predicted aspartyl protease|nr:aspartyl protease family protein [Pyrinomonadaceae bacterium]